MVNPNWDSPSHRLVLALAEEKELNLNPTDTDGRTADTTNNHLTRAPRTCEGHPPPGAVAPLPAWQVWSG